MGADCKTAEAEVALRKGEAGGRTGGDKKADDNHQGQTDRELRLVSINFAMLFTDAGSADDPGDDYRQC